MRGSPIPDRDHVASRRERASGDSDLETSIPGEAGSREEFPVHLDLDLPAQPTGGLPDYLDHTCEPEPLGTAIDARFAARGDYSFALTLDAAAHASAVVRRATSAPESIARHDAALAASREALDKDAADDAVRQGRDQTPDDMIDKALDYLRALTPDPPSAPEPATDPRRASSLTPRQLEVLELVVKGLSNKEIAELLHMSPKTTMHHCAAIYRALGVRGRTEATVWAARQGMLGQPEADPQG